MYNPQVYADMTTEWKEVILEDWNRETAIRQHTGQYVKHFFDNHSKKPSPVHD